MTGLTSEEILAIVVIVVVSIAMAGIGLLLLRRLHQRRDQIRGELSHRPEAVADRAFNRLAMARREADVLGQQGVPSPRARELIGESQAAFDARQFDRAYGLAQSAHETLVAARLRPAPAARSVDPPPPARAVEPPGPIDSPPAPPPGPKIPAHRAEAQFQLRLLNEDLARTRTGRTKDATARAQAFRDQAQQAFDRGDFAESFRLGLKGRRAAGGSVETLAPPVGGGAAAPDRNEPEIPDNDPARSADALASADRCPHCGHPTRADDAFCRGCGTPRTRAACEKCGAPRLPTDVFCARCGASFA